MNIHMQQEQELESMYALVFVHRSGIEGWVANILCTVIIVSKRLFDWSIQAATALVILNSHSLHIFRQSFFLLVLSHIIVIKSMIIFYLNKFQNLCSWVEMSRRQRPGGWPVIVVCLTHLNAPDRIWNIFLYELIVICSIHRGLVLCIDNGTSTTSYMYKYKQYLQTAT